MFESIPVLKYILTVVVSYLLGSLNTAIIVSNRPSCRDDIRKHGSGNAGFTNALRVMGPKWAVIVGLGDILKCAIAVVIGHLLFTGLQDIGNDIGAYGRLLAGLCAVLGHIFPLYFKFKGGKGAMTAAATSLFFDWRIFLLVMALFFIIIGLTKYVSLGSMLGSVMFAASMIYFYPDKPVLIAAGILLCIGICVMHRANIKRLLMGTESKLGTKKKVQ